MMGYGKGGTLILLALISVLLVTGEALNFVANDGVPDFVSKVVSEVADILVQRQGGGDKDTHKISFVDMKDAKLGETVTYELDIEVGGQTISFLLREEITSWRYLEDVLGLNANGSRKAIHMWQQEYIPAPLMPFQLAGPADLWVQDADNLRLEMPNDVDAGVLKKVFIADGAVVTVEGVREVGLTRPLKLPLPLIASPDNDGLGSTFSNLALRLRLASSSEGSTLSMRIVGPTTLLAAASESSEATTAGLTVLSPSAVELVSRNEVVPVQPLGNPLATPWVWPFESLNGSSPVLVGIGRALYSVLGPKAYQYGPVTLLKAKAKVASFVKISFEMESPVTNETLKQWPEWATKPSVLKNQFDLLASFEGNKLQPFNVTHVPGQFPTLSYAWSVWTGNQTYKGTPMGIINPTTLDYNWEDLA